MLGNFSHKKSRPALGAASHFFLDAHGFPFHISPEFFSDRSVIAIFKILVIYYTKFSRESQELFDGF